MASGLMDFFSKPEFAMWLGGVGQGLSQAGQPGGQFDMSQTNTMLMQRAMQEKRKEKLAGLMDQMGIKPEMREGLMGGLPYEVLAQGVAGQAFGGGDKAEWERKAENLMAMGAPRDVAYGLQTGRYKTVTDPVTKEMRVVDMASGRPYQGWQPPQQGAPQAPAQPQGGAPAPSQEPQGGFGVEDTADYPSAFGAEGVFKNLANVVTDFFGAGQMYSDSAAAKRQMENLTTQTSALLAQGVETRGGKWLTERFDEIQPKVSSIDGPEDALLTLEEIKGLLQRAYEIDSRIAQGAVSPDEKSKARANLERLRPLIQEYDQIIGTFSEQYRGGGGGQPQGGAPDAGAAEDGFKTTPGGVRYKVVE